MSNPSGVPPPSQFYPYGGPPPPNQSSQYGGLPPPNQPSPYGGPPQPNHPSPYAPVSTPYSIPSAPSKDNYGVTSQQHSNYGSYPTPPPYGSPFGSLVPSGFPPGTDPNVIACFQVADQNGSGFIDDKELQRALSSYNDSFGLRTVHLLMYHFTNSNIRKISMLR